MTFCTDRNYELTATTSEEQLARILKDGDYNMRKCNGEEYKESAVKTMWNVAAKQLQQKYLDEFQKEIDPFKSKKH